VGPTGSLLVFRGGEVLTGTGFFLDSIGFHFRKDCMHWIRKQRLFLNKKEWHKKKHSHAKENGYSFTNPSYFQPVDTVGTGIDINHNRFQALLYRIFRDLC